MVLEPLEGLLEPQAAKRERDPLAEGGKPHRPRVHRFVGPVDRVDLQPFHAAPFEQRAEDFPGPVHERREGDDHEVRRQFVQLPKALRRQPVPEHGFLERPGAEQRGDLAPAPPEPHHGLGADSVVAEERHDQDPRALLPDPAQAGDQGRIAVSQVRHIEQHRPRAAGGPPRPVEGGRRAVVVALLEFRGDHRRVLEQVPEEELAARTPGADDEQVVVRGGGRRRPGRLARHDSPRLSPAPRYGTPPRIPPARARGPTHPPSRPKDRPAAASSPATARAAARPSRIA